MEVTIDVVQSNVLVDEGTTDYDDKTITQILFSVFDKDIIPVSLSIDSIVSQSIGELKVQKSDLERVLLKNSEVIPQKEKFTVSLKTYLEYLEINRGSAITNRTGILFGLAYVFKSCSDKDPRNINQWRNLRMQLADPEKYFDEIEKDNSTIKLDRKRTLGEMQTVYKDLDGKVPEVESGFDLVYAGEQYEEPCFVGSIGIVQMKSQDKLAVDKTKIALVEKLRETEGPCLSKDAIDLYRQFWRTYNNAHDLVQKYGDIILNPHDWHKRFFRYDP